MQNNVRLLQCKGTERAGEAEPGIPCSVPMAAARTSSWLPLIVRLQQELDQCVSQKSTVILGKKFLPESVDLYLFRARLDVFLEDTPGEKPRLQWAVNWGKETKAERK